jgi:hypothetical protein
MCALSAIVLTGLIVSTATDAGAWATITVNSLADPGKPGICALRDAITAANTQTTTNGCVAGKGHDTIQFSVTGTILLASTLPEVTDSNLTMNGPASPGITIDGGGNRGTPFHPGVQVMQVASGATLNLNNVTVANGYFVELAEPIPVTAAGGITNQGTLTLTNSTFSKNGTGQGLAGGILNQGKLDISKSTFSGNSCATGAGGPNNPTGGIGGIRNEGELTISNSTFSGNNTNGDTGDGGILNLGTLTITNSTFSGNSGGGTGAIQNLGTATIIGSTFLGNLAGANGTEAAGGITNGCQQFCTAASPAGANVINSTFSGNGGYHVGGDIANGTGSTLTLTNGTLEGGISNFGVVDLKGTILGGKALYGNCGAIGFLNLPVTDLGYNVSNDNSCGFTATGSLNNTDPQLDPAGLANNGGPTQTIALVSGSPAIDAITVASCTDQDGNALTTDQRGFSRPDAAEAVCDIGAYEFQDFAGQPGAANCQGVSASALSHQFGNIKAAASALHFPSVKALQAAIIAFCRA